MCSPSTGFKSPSIFTRRDMPLTKGGISHMAGCQLQISMVSITSVLKMIRDILYMFLNSLLLLHHYTLGISLSLLSLTRSFPLFHQSSPATGSAPSGTVTWNTSACVSKLYPLASEYGNIPKFTYPCCVTKSLSLRLKMK